MTSNQSSAIDTFFRANPDLILEDKDLAEFAKNVIAEHPDTGSILVRRDEECRYLPFVLQGSVKIHRTAENGREIVLYHIEEGEGCILSALGIMNQTRFPAMAQVEQPSVILLVPARTLEDLIDRYPGWRRYVFAMYNERLGAVLELVDEMLFRKIDVRLARFLLERADDTGRVGNLTHQDVALELGSSREVISRVLKSLERRGLISYGRNRIDILDQKKLENIAQV